jgi:hypothetical protein
MSKNPPRVPVSAIVGAWIVSHFRARQAEAGTYVVAKQMRKQGYPLALALAVLSTKQ